LFIIGKANAISAKFYEQVDTELNSFSINNNTYAIDGDVSGEIDKTTNLFTLLQTGMP